MSSTNLNSVGFKSRKAAQVASYFAAFEDQGVDKLKLMKLIYLAEREFLSQYSHPMLYDEFYSLRHGPICTNTLNGIDGYIDKTVWTKFIGQNYSKVHSLVGTFREQYDELSDAEIDVLAGVWNSFGWMSTSQIRNYTHEHCPEYTEVQSGRMPISYKEVFEALGEPNADELEDAIMQYRHTENMLRA